MACTVALPAEIGDILSLIRLVANWMCGLSLAGACLSFVMIFIVPLSVYSRWASLPIMIFTFLAALFTTVAAGIATAMVRRPRPQYNASSLISFRPQVRHHAKRYYLRDTTQYTGQCRSGNVLLYVDCSCRSDLCMDHPAL